MNNISRPTAPPGVVLDTNVVLDWLLFHDPGCAAIAAAIESGAVRWLVEPALRVECAQVLERGVGAEWRPDLAAIWSAWDRHALVLAAPPPTGHPAPCRCSDPDDQKFIALALHGQARWLLSHDKAVLRLAAPARRLGLQILPPARWSMAGFDAEE